MQLEQRVIDKIKEACQTINENRRAGKFQSNMMRNFEHDGVVVTITFDDRRTG